MSMFFIFLSDVVLGFLEGDYSGNEGPDRQSPLDQSSRVWLSVFRTSQLKPPNISTLSLEQLLKM